MHWGGLLRKGEPLIRCLSLFRQKFVLICSNLLFWKKFMKNEPLLLSVFDKEYCRVFISISTFRSFAKLLQEKKSSFLRLYRNFKMSFWYTCITSALYLMIVGVSILDIHPLRVVEIRWLDPLKLNFRLNIIHKSSVSQPFLVRRTPT